MNRAYRDRIYDSYLSRGSGQDLTFDRQSAERRAWYLKPLLDGWLPASLDARIVDLGCGGGEVIFALQSFGYTDVRGVDVSAEQVAVAQQALGAAVIQADVFAHLETLAGQCDLLMAMDIIEHLDKTEVLRFLDCCRDALRPGGRLVLQTPNADSPSAATLRYGDFTHEVAFTPDSLARVMQAAGFEAIDARECTPRSSGLRGVARTILWKGLRWRIRLRNLVETGHAGSGVHTRVFLASGVRSP